MPKDVSPEFKKGHDAGYQRAKEFNASNMFDKITHESANRDHMSDEFRKGYEQGAHDANHGSHDDDDDD